MFAGKTTKLFEMFRYDSVKNKLVIDYKNEETEEIVIEYLHNHTEDVLDNVYKTNRLKKISDSIEIRDRSNIYINECQFFPDLKEFVLDQLTKLNNVYLYGLDGDFKQELFGQTMELIPYCKYIEKITGKCECCNNPSLVSYRTSIQKELYLPDSSCYIPLCLACMDSM